MLGLPLALTAPLALIGLVALPIIWMLIRITPPRPQRVPFPPIRILQALRPQDETPARTPPWLLALRLLLATIAILAMAGPLWNPPSDPGASQSPTLVLVDDGWPAAPTFDKRIAFAVATAEAAGRRGAPVAVAASSDGGREIALGDAAATLDRLRAMRPQPYRPDRAALVPALDVFFKAHPDAHTVWIAEGLGSDDARAFATTLASHSSALQVVSDDRPVRALAGARNEADGLDVRVIGTRGTGRTDGTLRAYDIKGLSLGETTFDLAGRAETTARFALPIELRNDVARVEIEGEKSAGAVTLLDDRFKRRRVGIVSGGSLDVAQPLLAPNYYLSRALAPFADVREARPGTPDPITALLDENVSVLCLADVGVVAPAAADRLTSFIEQGGVVLRFAGTRFAAAQDDFTPVAIRRGGRTLGGALSWEAPKKLAAFDAGSPFAGLTVPNEVTVTRQVLAEPDEGLPAKTWAHLADGTPLVTAERRGKGLLVLFHVTADTTWSNLPLSGLFPEMLAKIVALSGEVARTAGDNDADRAMRPVATTLSPTRTLDGFGSLRAPPATARPISAQAPEPAGPDHPPGFYGPADAAIAVNALGADAKIEPLDLSGLSVQRIALESGAPVDLRGPLILAAFLLLVADTLASIWLGRGGFGDGFRRRRALTAAIAMLCAAVILSPVGTGVARAQPTSPPAAQEILPKVSKRDMDAALTTRLAYVVTGDARVDAESRAGLAGLSRALSLRTSLVPGEPSGLDPARDELVFYPLLYWPIVAGRPQPSPEAVEKIGAFMKQGGTILFDTRDALTARPGGPATPEAAWLRQLLSSVDVPELEPVPRDHVVTKTFYLLDGFIGRTTIGQTWIEALPPEPADGASRPARAGDSVSPIVITSNDLAAAWASTPDGDAMYPLVPGGARQRELALRGGINLVMYTLTGNYKADQVHVRDLLERLGQ